MMKQKRGTRSRDPKRPPLEGADGPPAETPADEAAALAPLSGGRGQLQPADQVAAAMQMQVEILRKISDRQDRIEEAVRDARRSEMMLSSTRALNESFRGMRRIQERLLDRLRDDDGGRRTWLLVLVGCLLIAGGVAFGLWRLAGTVEEVGSKVGTGGEDAVSIRFAALKEEIGRLREDRHAQVKADLETRIAALGKAIDEIRAERDAARAGEAEKARENEALRSELEKMRVRAETAEEEASRLTARSLADQKLVEELTATLAALRGGEEGSRETASGPGPEAVATAAKEGKPEAEGGEPAVSRADDPASPDVEKLNELLSVHRGSENYRLVSAGSTRGDRLTDVVLEIRGQDGALSREVHAAALRFELGSKGEYLELVFETGHVLYHRGIGRVIKSPFFKNVYKVVVFGVDRRRWLSAGLPCVVLR